MGRNAVISVDRSTDMTGLEVVEHSIACFDVMYMSLIFLFLHRFCPFP